MSARVAIVLALALTVVATAASATETIPAVLHVHSSLSSGEFPLEQLADMASRGEIGALLVSENYRLRVDYGLPPFRALTRVTHEERSVMRAGADAYLAEVARVRRRFPGLVIVPGVEVIPHYWWSGSPFAGDLTLHDTQKNLLVFGVEDPDALRRLPVLGNPRDRVLTRDSVIEALPALLVVPGLLLLGKRAERVKVGRGYVLVRRRRWASGIVLLAIGVVALVRAWPFTVPRYPSSQAWGAAPYERLIEHVERLGGATVWSFPEARDAGSASYGPIRVAWRTDPYPDELLRTFDYTAFGGVYEDTTRFERPGEGWDALLRQYVRGERSRPAWAVGESGFHAFRAGKTLESVETVFRARARTPAGVLAALRAGSMYARRITPRVGLTLGAFTVAGAGHEAAMGETLGAAAGTAIDVRFAIDAQHATGQAVRVTLVRNGEVAGVWTGTTPFGSAYRETFDGTPCFFRLEARAIGADDRVLTNPVFVRR